MAGGKADAPKVMPTLFIGLGSTGAKIVSRIKRRLDATDDDLTRQFYRYLRITSETTPETGVDEDIPGFVMATRDLDGSTAVRVFQDSQDQSVADDFKRWWPRESPNSKRPWVPRLTKLDKGAGGCRPIGRLLLHYAGLSHGEGLLSTMRGIKQSIQRDFAELEPVRKKRVAGGGDSSIECYLFGMLAGGTCSGSLFDVAYIVRTGLGSVNLYGAMLLGDICYFNKQPKEEDRIIKGIQRKNTVCALAELSLIQCSAGHDVVQGAWISRVGAEELPADILRRYPFDRMVFVGADNDAGHTLGSFEAYQEFVADFYARLHTSQATIQQINRDVDRENAEILELDHQFPSRFNQSSRIGMLSLSVPVRKIMAAATSKAAIRLAANHFKNADEARWQRAQNEFLRQVRWPETSTLIAPALEDLSNEQFRPLPEKRDEFRGLYEQRLEDIKGRYERWKRLHDTDAQAKHNEFVQLWRGAIQDLIHDFLGRSKGTDVSLGGVKAVVRSVLDHVVTRIAELSDRALEIQTQLQRQGDANPEHTFRTELDAVIANFPESSLVNPIAMYWRLNWTDDQNLQDILRSYRDAVRIDAITTVTTAALKQVKAELELVELARALTAGSARGVLEGLQRAADDEFDAARSQARTPHEEVLKQRDEVETYFVDPMLEQADPAAEPAGDGARATRLESLCADVMSGWRTEDGQPLYGAFEKLVESLREVGARNEQEAQKFQRVKIAVDSLKMQFERQVSAAVDRHLSGPVGAMSVWNALAAYARKQDGDVTTTLLDYFLGLRANVGFFTRLSRDAGLDQDPKGRRSYYVCDTEEAEREFKDLGIKDPESFLRKLMENALGYQPVAMEGVAPKRSEIVVLMFHAGDTPLFFAGFHNDVRRALHPEGAVERKNDYSWADRRTPEWIAAWHDSNPPKLPKSSV